MQRPLSGRIDIKARPDVDSRTADTLYEKAVVPSLREVVGRHPLRHNQRWVKTAVGALMAYNRREVAYLLVLIWAFVGIGVE